jgi:transitional endoplasmic reticulum ATPase
MTMRFIVDGAASADEGRGVVRLSRAAMAALGLRPGDIAAVSGSRTAHGRVLPAREGEEDRIALDAGQRRSAGVGLGDAVAVALADTPPPAASARLRARGRAPDAEALRAALEEAPVSAGDWVVARLANGRRVDLEVLAVAPGPVARLTASTDLDVDAAAEDGAWRGVAGLDVQVARVREMVELPMRRPDLFARLGVTPPRGVLFSGPPGSGKTLLARAVAEASGAAFFQIDGPEIVSKHYGDSEAKLREVFAEAHRKAPAVIFIDEIDAIAPKRESLSGEKQLERRLVAQLLTLMDGLSARGQVVVMAATNMPQALDPALRRPGRFDREIAFTPPDRAGRRAILDVHFADAPLADDVDLDALADATAGFVGADLAALARESAMAAVGRCTAAMGGVANVAAKDLFVTAADIEAARATVRPSALRATHVEIPEARWDDVGGLEDVKSRLTEAVIWPIRHPEPFRAVGVTPISGLLMVGGPGAGKTLLARALAAESGVNFIAARGANLLSRFLGEAERAVADLFDQARLAAPCILFFDEIDAVAPARGSADPALARVVAQLLVEIDGITAARGVFLLGATNRVEAIDPALLRPGRFDEVIALAPPDADARRDILAVHTASMPLGDDVALSLEATATPGWSGAELRALAQGAARRALRRAVTLGAEPVVTAADFAAARAETARRRRAMGVKE